MLRIRPIASAVVVGMAVTVSSFPTSAQPGAPSAAAATDEDAVATSAAGGTEVVLADKPVRIVLGSSTGAPASLANRLQNLGPGKDLILELKGLSASEAPGVIYSLYLDLPPGAKPSENDPRYVGAFNFFGFAPVPDAERRPQAQSGIAYTYDVTGLARMLQRRGLLRDPLSVTIVPSGTPAAGARVVLGEIALVEQ